MITSKNEKAEFYNPLSEQRLISRHEEKLEILKQDFGISFQLPEVAHDQQGEHVTLKSFFGKISIVLRSPSSSICHCDGVINRSEFFNAIFLRPNEPFSFGLRNAA